MTIEPIEESDKQVYSDEPIEESDKQVYSEDDATSIVKNPFGLKGRFKITYCRQSGSTD